MDIKWRWNGLSNNPNITMKFINKYPNMHWDWAGISKNGNITMDDIKQNPEKPWDWYVVSSNPNLTLEMIKEHPEKRWDLPSIMSGNNKISIEKLMEIATENDMYFELSHNTKLTAEIIINNLDKKWCWPDIARNSGIDIHDMMCVPNFQDNYTIVLQNSNLTEEIYETIWGIIKSFWETDVCYKGLINNTKLKILNDINMEIMS